MRRAVLVLTALLAGCAGQAPVAKAPPRLPPQPLVQVVARAAPEVPAGPDLTGAVPVEIWTTIYSVNVVEPVPSGGVPLRDMKDRVIGPSLHRSDWCRAAVEGTVKVGNAIFTFAGTRAPRQARCSHGPSSSVRWRRVADGHVTGATEGTLKPFRSIACDVGTVSGSEPWVGGGFPRLGQRLFIPEAQGVTLPDGTVHDGIFTCADVGGGVNGNHVDIFLGEVAGGPEAARAVNPFPFVGHSRDRTVQAWLLPENDP